MLKRILLTAAVLALAVPGSVLAGDRGPVENVTKGTAEAGMSLVKAPGKIVENIITTTNPVATTTRDAAAAGSEVFVGGAAKGVATTAEGGGRIIHKAATGGRD